MNLQDPERWSTLVNGHLLGTLSQTDTRQLEELLAQNAAARADFRRRCNLDAALRHEAQSTGADSALLNAPAPARLKWSTAMRWAAAVLVGGLFGGPWLWALATPRMVAHSARVAPFADGSFETRPGLLAAGFPTRFGVWTGDPAESVSIPSVEPRNGQRVLRLLSPSAEGSADPVTARACDVFQLVDLRPLRSSASSGDAFLELSANILDTRPQPGPELHFLCKLCLFSGDPARIRERWPASLSEALASSAQFRFTRGGAPEWQTLATRVILPPQADFALVHIGAGRMPGREPGIVELGAQFIDRVSLTLRTQPVLPVRGPNP